LRPARLTVFHENLTHRDRPGRDIAAIRSLLPARKPIEENLMNFLAPWTPQLLSVLRIMSGLLLLQHGTTKYLNFPTSPMNDASALSMGGIAGILELVGGVLLVMGLFTRPVAFILSGMTAAAYFIAHAPQGFFPLLNGGELAALYCFVFLFIAAAGGGAWSVDRARGEPDAIVTARGNARARH
jgi:putative oxidoreductase